MKCRYIPINEDKKAFHCILITNNLTRKIFEGEKEMKLNPLQQFICDECQGVIKKIDDGWVEWFDGDENPLHGFRIVHASEASPRFEEGGNCNYPENPNVSDHYLKVFTGPDGLAWLLAFFERKLADPNELAEIIRRLHIPHYEEARHYLERAYTARIIDDKVYGQEDLKKVIKEYGND